MAKTTKSKDPLTWMYNEGGINIIIEKEPATCQCGRRMKVVFNRDNKLRCFDCDFLYQMATIVRTIGIAKTVESYLWEIRQAARLAVEKLDGAAPEFEILVMACLNMFTEYGRVLWTSKDKLEVVDEEGGW